ncbi:hypothetical protein CO655_12595 [Rhizobium sp. M1]|nr:hypothetical protein CO655_12595 [Rhizobium sp. M1]
MQPLIRPAGHLLPARGGKETRSDLPEPNVIRACTLFQADRGLGREHIFHLSCASRPFDKNRQKP